MNVHTLEIGAEHLQDLYRLAERVHPHEAAALLLGRVEEGRARVVEVRPVENIDQSPVSFRVEPEVLYQVYKYADEVGLELVAIFHSHPGAATPSGIDREYMALNPVVWLILSTPTGEFKAYILHQDEIKRIVIRVLEGREKG